MSKRDISSVMSFSEAVAKTNDVSNGYCSGLGPLNPQDKKHIFINGGKCRSVGGSVDIDTCTKSLYPDAHRWDYAIEFDSKVCFVEFHPAETKNVREMIDKKAWLLSWLKDKAPLIDALPRYSPGLIWVASGRINIIKTSSQYRQAAQAGLLPRKRLEL